MALDTIPPWISVSPADYLHAVQAGGSAGLGIAEAQNRAREAAARTAEAQRAAAQQQWEFGERMRQAAEEHASREQLDASKLAQESAQLAQTGRYQEGMLGYHNRSLDDSMARAAMANESRGNLLDLRAQHYNDLRDWRDREQTLKEQIAANKVQPTDYETVTETVPAVESAIPAQPARPFEKKSLLGIDWLWPDQQASPATPAIEPHGERKITRRVPIGGRLGASSPSLEAPPEPLPSDNQLGTSVDPNMGSLLDVQPTEPTAGVVAVYDPKTKKFTSTVKTAKPLPSFYDVISSPFKTPPPDPEVDRVVPESALRPSGFLTSEIPVQASPTITESIPTPTTSSGPNLGEREIRDLYKVARLSKSQANELLQGIKDRAAGRGKIFNFEPIDGPEWSKGRETSFTHYGKHWNPVTHKWESEFE